LIFAFFNRQFKPFLNFSFQYPVCIWLFAALAAITILFFFLLGWKKKVKKRIGDEKLVNHLIRGYSAFKFNLKFFCLSVAFAAGIIASMNPRQAGTQENIIRKGIDVVIALDVSKSMLAQDVQPSRLERAKQLTINLMNQMPNDRIGLVLFAGKAYLQMPLTSDHAAAKLFVASAGPGSVPKQGTVLSEAMRMSAAAFNNKEKRFKSVVLISDGEDHDAEALQTAAALAEQGVMLNTIGIGSPEGTTITEPITGETKKDESGNPVISGLNEELLRQTAAATNGIYRRLQSSDETIAALLNQFSQIEKKSYGDSSLLDYKNFFQWFAAAMLVLLLAEFFISEVKPKS
jgi:Ca-activated chloride channel family protein